MAHSNDIKFIQVVFKPIDLLIPGHATLQARHGMGRIRPISRFDMESQAHLTTTSRNEEIRHLLQLASHEGKQIGGFGEGIVPNGVVPVAAINP